MVNPSVWFQQDGEPGDLDDTIKSNKKFDKAIDVEHLYSIHHKVVVNVLASKVPSEVQHYIFRS